MSDQVLISMATELRDALVSRGLDPTDPPAGGPPSSAAFAEYQRRGGTAFTDADQMAAELIREVGSD